MTRVNAGIEPCELCDQMLIAEHREMGRIWPLAIRRQYLEDPCEDIPPTFRFGTGHMKFFIDKGLYLKRRFEMIKREMRRRCFVSRINWRPWPGRLNCDWNPSVRDRYLSMERIYIMYCTMKEEPRWTATDIPDWYPTESEVAPALTAALL